MSSLQTRLSELITAIGADVKDLQDSSGPGFHGGATAIDYIFSTTTTDSDPGSGTLRLNNSTQTSATALYFNLLDINGFDVTNLLASAFGALNSSVKAIVRVYKTDDPKKFISFSGLTYTTATGYRKFRFATVLSSSGSSPIFADGDAVTLDIYRPGDTGNPGLAGATWYNEYYAETLTGPFGQAFTLDSLTPSSVTKMWISCQANDGSDNTLLLGILKSGDVLRIQHSTIAGRWIDFQLGTLTQHFDADPAIGYLEAEVTFLSFGTWTGITDFTAHAMMLSPIGNKGDKGDTGDPGEPGTSLIKATGAEVNTGTDDVKYVTAKGITDSNVAFLADIPAPPTVPVKATGTEIDTGTDDAKFATPKAIADSGVAYMGDLAAYVAKSLFDANTILAATTDDTPAALTMDASTILARLAAGDIVAATPAQLRTLLALVIGTNVQAWDADLDAIAALSATNDDVVQRKAGAWTNRTLAQLATDLALSKFVPLQPLNSAASAAATNLALNTWSAVSDPNFRAVVDLRGLTKLRFTARISGSLVAATKMRIQYHPDGNPAIASGDAGWAELATSAGSHTVATVFYTAELSVPSGAQIATCVIRAGLYSGDGAADPTMTGVLLNFYA